MENTRNSIKFSIMIMQTTELATVYYVSTAFHCMNHYFPEFCYKMFWLMEWFIKTPT